MTTNDNIDNTWWGAGYGALSGLDWIRLDGSPGGARYRLVRFPNSLHKRGGEPD